MNEVAPDALQIRIGQLIDRYVVEEFVGYGGMAQVYRVSHLHLHSTHALKVVTLLQPDMRQRVLDEGRAQAGLHHPNVLAVTDATLYRGLPCLVMEFVEGPSLWALLEDFEPTVEEALELFRGILRGVDAAHQHGLVHRDLKPDNILLAGDEHGVVPKVCDFGLVKIVGREDGKRVTSGGGPLGTPGYMAPEQITDASNVDHRADLFSLGCILYQLCTCQEAFSGDNSFAIHTRIITGDYVHPQRLNPALPKKVALVIERLLQPDRDKRFADTGALMDALYGSAQQVRSEEDEEDNLDSVSTVRPEARDWVVARSSVPAPVSRQRHPPHTPHTEQPVPAHVTQTLHVSPGAERVWNGLIAFLCSMLGVVFGLLVAQSLGLY